mgnify:FL=1
MTIEEYRADDGLGGELRLYADPGETGSDGKGRGYSYVLIRKARDFLELIQLGAGADPIMWGAILKDLYTKQEFKEVRDGPKIPMRRFRQTILELLNVRSLPSGGRGGTSVIGDDLVECLGV